MVTIIEKLEDFPSTDRPIILTIGNFDGMHRGHAAVLRQAGAYGGDEGQVVVLTFSNHPSEILRPKKQTPLLCSLPHKLRLLQQFGVETILLLTFTRYFAKHSAASFVENVRQHIPFTHLVLGHDATIGRDRQGNSATMEELGMVWGFHVHYLEEYRYEAKPVSSTRIREALQEGNLKLVEELLNRPYSIYGTALEVDEKVRLLNSPSFHLDVFPLCLPPFGVYAIEAIDGEKTIQGIANLRIAPSFKPGNQPILEVHLFDDNHLWLNRDVEICFKSFIRHHD